MQVSRASLPGAATIVVFGSQRHVIVDASLTRDQAALAIQGVLPDLHPDIVDHWLDRQFERRPLPFTARHITALAGAALAVLGIFTGGSHHAHHDHGVHGGFAHAPIVLAVPGTRTA